MEEFLKKIQFVKTKDGSHTLYNPLFKESYHSLYGAITESKHVFIQSGLVFYYLRHQPDDIIVGEMGFGTGLNAFLTLIWAEKNKVHIVYETYENFPIPIEQIEKLNYSGYFADHFKEKFLLIHQASWNRLVQITPYFSIKKIQRDFHEVDEINKWNVVYFDAFGPRVQPELWNERMMKKMYLATAYEGVFVTYSAKGQVRRNLLEAGFEVEKIPGPPGKREMLRAIKKVLS